MMACGLAAACTGPSQKAQAVSAAVGRADAGLTAGPEGGFAPGSSAQLGLSTLERRRLLEAARQAFYATADVPTSYTVVPENIDAEPTTVTATPAGVRTTSAALALGERHGVELPLAAQMAAVLEGRTSARSAVETLMLRPQRAENDHA